MAQQNIKASPEPVPVPVPNLLRRLERELAPLADATSPPLEHRFVRSVTLRIFERMAIGGMMLMAIGSMWILAERWQRLTDANPSTDESATTLQRELSQLKQTLSNVEAERDKLRQDVEEHRLQNPVITSWHENTSGLNYRSPWQK